jgi:hypothetical protein
MSQCPPTQHNNKFFKSKEQTRKSILQAGSWWLMPVILATWEAEIRRNAI